MLRVLLSCEPQRERDTQRPPGVQAIQITRTAYKYALALSPPSTSSSRIFRPNSTSWPALCRGMIGVCGSNRDNRFAPAGTASPWSTRRDAGSIPWVSRGRTVPGNERVKVTHLGAK
jgi:hypothetical protein